MISYQKFLDWYPDFLSEDRVNIVILQAVLNNKWELVYYNPPSGSWKGISLYHEGYEYRQVGPKRGVKRFKRPDVAFQDLTSFNNSLRFLLFESKKSHQGWDRELPRLLKTYFEDEKEGIRRLPFDHRRKKGEELWEKLSKGHPYRDWFVRAKPHYIYGFAYGPITEANIKEEQEWMTTEIKALDDNNETPPLVIVALSFASPTMKPVVLRGYSKTFPEYLYHHLEARFKEAETKG